MGRRFKTLSLELTHAQERSALRTKRMESSPQRSSLFPLELNTSTVSPKVAVACVSLDLLESLARTALYEDKKYADLVL